MKGKLLLITAVMAGLLFFFGSANAQGGTLPLNITVNGNISSSGGDLWDVTTNADGLLRLTMTAASPADLYLGLYDNDGITPLGGLVESFNNSTVTISKDGLAPGTYRVVVIPFGMRATGAYSLADSLFTTPLTIDAEPNRDAAHADVLPLNAGKTGHVGYYYNKLRDTADWYKVTTTTHGLLRVYLSIQAGSKYSTSTTNPLDVNVTLYDNNGTTQIGAVEVFNGYNAAANFITADGLAPGTYYIKVQPFSTAQFANYTLSDTLYKTPVANDQEPNANAASAVVLPLNGKKTGQVGYYYNHLRDTADWYKVTTTTNGLLRVYLSTQAGSVYSTSTTNPLDVNITLYDNNGTTQLGAVEVFNGYNAAANFITADGLAPGTYYIKVQPFSTAQFANYTLSDTLYKTPVANDPEPNANAASAVVLPLNGKKTGQVGYYYNHLRDTADWYKVTTTTNGLLRVYLSTQAGSKYSTSTTNPLDVNVTLYDNNGTTQLGAVEVFNSYNAATNFITADGLAAGTYYIKVQPYSTSQFANYTVSDTLFTNSFKPDLEPNGSRASALVLPLNASDTGQVGYFYNNQRDTADWYKVTTTTDGLLRVYLTTSRASVYSSNPLDVNVSLYDNNGTTQLGAVEVFNNYNPATNFISMDGLAPGTYYIKVQPFSTAQFANYIITDSLFVPAVTADAEPNRSPASALAFPLNSNTKGHVGYYYNSQRDTADWFKITVPADGPLNVYLSTQRGSVYSTNTLDMIMTFYRSDGVTQLGIKEVYKLNGPAVDSLNFLMLTTGDYYVKITNFSTTQFGDYSLTNSVSAASASLPVNFTSFSGVLLNGQALLNWSTATETNNKGFEVQRSADGQTFTTLGFVKGHGTSSAENNYTYTDATPLSAAGYYRLKQTDLDGNFVYSTTILLDNKNFDWIIFGNPVTANSWLQLNLTRQSHISILVSSMDGKILQRTDKGIMAEGTHAIALNLGGLAHGTYIITLVRGGEAFSKLIAR